VPVKLLRDNIKPNLPSGPKTTNNNTKPKAKTYIRIGHLLNAPEMGVVEKRRLAQFALRTAACPAVEIPKTSAPSSLHIINCAFFECL